MLGVNTCCGPSTLEYQEEQCTRYCHDHGCPHAERKYDGTYRLARLGKKANEWNIQAMHRNPFGLNYQEANLLVYVLLFPSLMALLLWGALKK